MSATVLRKPEETRRRLADVYAPIAEELAESERIFAEELGSRSEIVQRLVSHCADYHGKRLRPALVLLAAQACGEVRPAHPVLAAVVEMIHTATLVHDDILDEAAVRRHAATVNAEWGNESAVLLGDYLFTHAFHLAASLETTLACRLIGRATNLVCEGELQQIHNRGNLDLDEATYFEIIAGKTAELTAVCGRLGAHYAGADPQRVAMMEGYGRDLGIAFQIADDVLDLWGEERHHRQDARHRPGQAEADAAGDPPAGDLPSREGRRGAGLAPRPPSRPPPIASLAGSRRGDRLRLGPGQVARLGRRERAGDPAADPGPGGAAIAGSQRGAPGVLREGVSERLADRGPS